MVLPRSIQPTVVCLMTMTLKEMMSLVNLHILVAQEVEILLRSATTTLTILQILRMRKLTIAEAQRMEEDLLRSSEVMPD